MNFTDEELNNCYEFAKNMKGNHHPSMIMKREDWEIFRDDFRGKLGEVALRKHIEANIPTARISTDIDYSVTPRGQWDITDLVVNGKYISVKSINGNSHFLMIEQKRYNSDGTHRYKNNDGSDIKVDFYVLVRVSIDPEIQEKDTCYASVNDFLAPCTDKKRTISADILGGISHNHFWNDKKRHAPAGMWCNAPNLWKAYKREEIDMATPSEIEKEKNKRYILQQDNYIVPETFLKPIHALLR